MARDCTQSQPPLHLKPISNQISIHASLYCSAQRQQQTLQLAVSTCMKVRVCWFTLQAKLSNPPSPSTCTILEDHHCRGDAAGLAGQHLQQSPPITHPAAHGPLKRRHLPCHSIREGGWDKEIALKVNHHYASNRWATSDKHSCKLILQCTTPAANTPACSKHLHGGEGLLVYLAGKAVQLRYQFESRHNPFRFVSTRLKGPKFETVPGQ